MPDGKVFLPLCPSDVLQCEMWQLLRSWKQQFNRPLPSTKNSQFQNECKTFLVKMSFICMGIRNHFLINSFARSLALKQRLGATRKWPILLSVAPEVRNPLC